MHTCIEGGWPGARNISAPPRFVDLYGPDGVAGTPDDNLRLTAASPCIDAGSNALISPATKTDLDGAPRFFDAPAVDVGSGPPPIIDMGAYEFHINPPLPGDVNADGVVNGFDIDAFVTAILDPDVFWGIYPTGDMRNADMNIDGRVNNFDIDAFVTLIIGQ